MVNLQTDPQRHGVIATDTHTVRQTEKARHNARYYSANNNNNTATGGYKHNSIFI